jgi:hypothetical protein
MMSNVDARAAALASEQDALITLEQASACGITVDQRKGRTGSGRWELVVRGVYRMAGAPETWRQRVRAAQLSVARAGGVASHVSSGALHRLLDPSLLPHVTVEPTSSARCRIAKVHRSSLDARDVCTIDGIRTTTVSRMIVDMAAVLDRPALEALVDDAVCQRKATPASILDAAARVPSHRRGLVLLRSVLHVWASRIDPGSQAEVRLLRRLAEWGIEAPVTQFEIRDASGGFVARVDVAWPHRKVALEYEGVRHHAARRVDADEQRYATIRALGWHLAVADKVDLLPGSTRLRDLLAHWLTVCSSVA